MASLLEKMLAAQSEALKRVNTEVRGDPRPSSTTVSSSTANGSVPSTATRNNEQVVQIEEDLIKIEQSPSISLNTTAAQLRNSGGTSAEDLESRKRKRDETTTTEAPSNKAPRTGVSQSPRQSVEPTSVGVAINSSISPSLATNPMPMHNTQPTQAINRDESLIANFFGDTQSSPIPRHEMRMDEDQDIDLNDASFDLMADYSSQSQNAHVDAAKPIATGVDLHGTNNANVTGLVQNIHKLLKAYSVIVPEQAEQLQTSMVNAPDQLASLDLVSKISNFNALIGVDFQYSALLTSLIAS